MRGSLPLLISLALLLAVPTTPGCQKKPGREEALRSLHEGMAGLNDLLRRGPSTWVVAGPKQADAPFLEDASRWAAEEMAITLRDEGFDDLVGSKDEPPAGPVRDVKVASPGPVEELISRARAHRAQVLVFVGVRSIELQESTPTRLEWSYDGSIEIVEADGDGSLAWAVTGTSKSQMPNDVPQDADKARRPLAEKWARGALRTGALGLGALSPTRDGLCHSHRTQPGGSTVPRGLCCRARASCWARQNGV